MHLKRDISIRGWLLIPFLGFHIVPAWIIYTTAKFIVVLSDGIWRLVTDSSSKLFNPLVPPFFVFEIVVNAALAGLSVWVLYLMYGCLGCLADVWGQSKNSCPS